MSTKAAQTKPGQLTAMISSTALDLPEHRTAVKEACLSAGVFPIGMEHLPARDDSGITVSLEMVDKADIYLGIYAWRYGWVPDGKPVSVTEMEFDRAVDRQAAGKLREILIFTAHDDHPFTKKDIETGDDAQKKLTSFKTKATTGRVRKEFKSVEELRRLVSESLHEFKHRQHGSDLRHSSSCIPHSSTPNNLPRLQPFFGRAAELATIREALDPDSRTWGALIDGPGGMGKTSLAVRAAYDCPPGLFQRIVFVSVKDREMDDDGERPLGNLLVPGFLEMLNELARELGQPDIAKSPEDQRIRLLLGALRPAQALLILDNLESLPKADRDQLFTFVKRLPPGCKAILTSRRRIGSGSEELILEKLDQDAALATLADLARRHPLLARTSEAERIALYTQTAGKPLLLRWAAGQLSRGSCRTFPDALAFLRTCPPDNDPLEFIFGDLAKEFTPDEEKVLCALTYFSLPAKVEHLAVIAGLKSQSVETALGSLANRSLVVPDKEEKEYTLVPMVADFLRKHRTDVVAETGERLEKCAFEFIQYCGWDNHDRFPILKSAWSLVDSAIPFFLAGENRVLQGVCHALCEFLNFTGRWDEWLSLNQYAETKARDAGDFFEAGWRAFHQGFVHAQRHEPDKLIACAERLASYWAKIEVEPRERALIWRMRGDAYGLMREYDRAIVGHQAGLELLQRFSADPKDIAGAHNSLAGAYTDSGDNLAAQKNYRKALGLARAANYPAGVAMYLGNLSLCSLHRRCWRRAEILTRNGLDLMEPIGREPSIAADCDRLAQALVKQGKAAEALPYSQRAVEIYSRLRLPDLGTARATLREVKNEISPTTSTPSSATLG